jgi:hypothetical protein
LYISILGRCHLFGKRGRETVPHWGLEYTF